MLRNGHPNDAGRSAEKHGALVRDRRPADAVWRVHRRTPLGADRRSRTIKDATIQSIVKGVVWRRMAVARSAIGNFEARRRSERPAKPAGEKHTRFTRSVPQLASVRPGAARVHRRSHSLNFNLELLPPQSSEGCLNPEIILTFWASAGRVCWARFRNGERRCRRGANSCPQDAERFLAVMPQRQ